ncbi:hypothetical protein [Pseudaquabacterium rugosum]|uniref:Haemin-degrading HemS/ChuX domain-containing protein n=1 Tax=Pseudaquabacterium rugosum TaxID=2984194 RepID=A0ABU9BH54_9BURK
MAAFPAPRRAAEPALRPAPPRQNPWQVIDDGPAAHLARIDRLGPGARDARIVGHTQDLRRRLRGDTLGWAALQPLVAAAIGIRERQLLEAHLHHPTPPCPDSHSLQVRPLPLDADGLHTALATLWPLRMLAQGRHGSLRWQAGAPPSAEALQAAGLGHDAGSGGNSGPLGSGSSGSGAGHESAGDDSPRTEGRVWAVEARAPDGGVQRSLQLIDGQGRCTLQWLLDGPLAPVAWLDLMDDAARSPMRPDTPQTPAGPGTARAPARPASHTAAAPTDRPAPPSADGLSAALQQGWRALRDPRQWAPLCATLGLSLDQALRLAPEGYARQLGTDAAVELMTLAAQSGQRCGLRLTPSLPVCAAQPREVRLRDGWLLAEGQDFELRLRLSAIDSCWLLNRPGRDGLHQSLLLLDREGRALAELGEAAHGLAPSRPPCDWRLLLQGLLPAALLSA